MDRGGLHRRGVAAARVVDLLGEWLDGVEAGEEHRHAREQHERRRAGPRAAQSQPRRRHRGARAGRHERRATAARRGGRARRSASGPCRARAAAPRAQPGQLHGQLAAQDDHGAQVLHGGGEPQLPHERGATLGRLERCPPQQGEPGHDQRRRPARRETSPVTCEAQRPQQRGRRTARWGCRRCTSAPSATAGASSATPSSDAAQRGRRSPPATSAAPTDSTTVVSPTRAPVAIHATLLAREALGRQVAGDAAHEQPDEGEEAELAHCGRPQGAGAVDRGEEDVADLGPSPSASGPPRLPDRSPRAMANAAMPPSHPGPSASTWRTWTDVASVVPHRARRDGHRHQPEDPGQVGLVEGVDPVDVGDALLTPELPPVDEGTLEVGVGISGQHRRDATDRRPRTCTREPRRQARRPRCAASLPAGAVQRRPPSGHVRQRPTIR